MSFPVVIQAWPRSLTRDQACAYASAGPTQLPAASYSEGRSPRWLREDLDRWLDQRAGRRAPDGTIDDWLKAATQ